MILKNLTSLLSAVVLFSACSNHTSQIVTTRFDSNGNEISQKVTVLDKAGNKICETLYSLQDSILQQYLKTEYFFEVTGSRTDSIHINYSYVSGKWKADDKSICSFDSCGHRTELRTFRWNDGKWNECEPLYWVYDSIGRLTYSLSGMTREEHKYSLESDTTLFYYSSDYKEFLPTYMWVDSLDRNGNPLLTIRYRWIDDNWQNYGRTERYYSKDDRNLSEETEYEWDGGNWTPLVRTVSVYDTSHHLVSEEIQHPYGGGWLGNYRNEFKYSEKGMLLLHTSDRNFTPDTDTTAWPQRNRKFVKYEYDRKGRLVKVSKYYLTDDSGDYVEYKELIRYYNTSAF